MRGLKNLSYKRLVDGFPSINCGRKTVMTLTAEDLKAASMVPD